MDKYTAFGDQMILQMNQVVLKKTTRAYQVELCGVYIASYGDIEPAMEIYRNLCLAIDNAIAKAEQTVS